MRINLDMTRIEDYAMFLNIKRLPQYRFVGRTAIFPDEYADKIGLGKAKEIDTHYEPINGLFDYQRDITRLAIQKGKFCVFADCGLGKTLIFLEFARHVAATLKRGQCVLIISPLMVIGQTMAECAAWYGGSLPIERVESGKLNEWLKSGKGKIGITNYEGLNDDTDPGRLAGLILDESSMLKSHYGKWGTTCLRLGRGLRWKLACTGTPAPNDRIEYANHAVFMDAFPTVNSFLARFFVNRGETGERWELKPHALAPFYRALSHWCIFLTNPATYGWEDNTETIPPIVVHIHDVKLTDIQQGLAYDMTGELFANKLGGIKSRSVLGQIAKGNHRGQEIESHKPEFIRRLVESWPTESTIIWCIYNAEQERIAREFPDAANIDGTTPMDVREKLVAEFKRGDRRVIISKPKVLGFGLNLQIATRQVFSGLQDSYESYYQAVKRSNRYGSKSPLNVHIPVTDIEQPMVANVLRKAAMVQTDTETQERIFKEHGYVSVGN